MNQVQLTLHSRIINFSLAAALAVLFIAGRVSAITTLPDYTERLSRAVTLVEEMRSVYEDESGHHPLEQVYSGNLALVRQYLPATETVNVNGQRIEIDNSWLQDDLKDFEKSTKAADRRDALARMAERLQAIRDQVLELQNATSAPNAKDANKGRLAEILRRPEYDVHPQPEGNALEQLIDRFLRWLSRLFPHPKPMQPGSSRLISAIAQILVVVVCIVAIGLLIWRFGPRLVGGRRKKKKKREPRIVLGERLDPDQTAADLLAQAEDLARTGNLRAAIRKAYIALLCELGDRKIISLAQHKTNRDYLNALRDKGSLYPWMRKLTSTFELHWYGFVPAAESDWHEFRSGFRKIFGDK